MGCLVPGCDTLVGIEGKSLKAKGKSGLRVFPNPASTFFEVVFSKIQTMTYRATLRVYDMRGVLVFEEVVGAAFEPLKVNASAWENGVYIVELRDGGKVYSEKVVVSKP